MIRMHAATGGPKYALNALETARPGCTGFVERSFLAEFIDGISDAFALTLLRGPDGLPIVDVAHFAAFQLVTAGAAANADHARLIVAAPDGRKLLAAQWWVFTHQRITITLGGE